jgi:hypothetical protein
LIIETLARLDSQAIRMEVPVMSRFPRITDPSVAWQVALPAQRKRAKSTNFESVVDHLAALERIATTQQYPGGPPEIHGLRDRAELVMDIEERAQQIEDDARDRTVARRLGAAERLLPMILKATTTLLIGVIVVLVVLTIDRHEFDAALHLIVSLHGAGTGSAVAVALGGAAYIAHKKRSSMIPADETEESDLADEA